MYRGSRYLGKITGPITPPISSNFRRWSAERFGRRGGIWWPKLERPKRAVQKTSWAEVHPWLATDAHGNKQTNKQTNKGFRTKTANLEIFLLHHGIFLMIPLSTLTEKSKLNVEYRFQLLFGFQINFSFFCAGRPLDK
jgi:hypothetical protein